ncbi:hypothetical protein MNV49_004626 [Pseudohyphozyma bogoriensis]|nr:hypothetical protein MNV49_004626 [Pseudohyphozyma bogoriensis]
MSFFTEMRPNGHPYLKKAPADVLLRQSRRSSCELEERKELDDRDEFVVTGSEGDDYVVTIGGDSKTRVGCSCPDKVVPCKHISFVYLDVLQLDKTNPLVWQTAFTPKEVLKLLPRLASSSPNDKKRAASPEPSPSTSKKARGAPPPPTRVYAARITEAIEAMHSLEGETPEEQEEQSPEVMSEVSEIIKGIEQDAINSPSSDATRSNAISAIVTIATQFKEAPLELREFLYRGGCPSQVVHAIANILVRCEKKLDDKVLSKIEELESPEEFSSHYDEAGLEEKLMENREKE